MAFHVAPLLLIFLAGASGLREAEIGKNDWVIKGIGRATALVAGTRHGRVYVGSDLGILAAVDTGTGRLLWRAVHHERDAVVDVILGREIVLAVTSRTKDTLRHSDAPSSYDSVNVPVPEGAMAVYAYVLATGQLLWTTNDQSCYYNSACVLDIDAAVALLPGRDTADPGTVVAHLANNVLRLTDIPISAGGVPRDHATISAEAVGELCGYSDVVMHRVFVVEDQVFLLASVPKQAPQDGSGDEGERLRSVTSVEVDFLLTKLGPVSGDLRPPTAGGSSWCKLLRVPNVTLPRTFIKGGYGKLSSRSPISLSSDATTLAVWDIDRGEAWIVSIADAVDGLLAETASDDVPPRVTRVDLMSHIGALKSQLPSNAPIDDHLGLEVWDITALPLGGAVLTNGRSTLVYASQELQGVHAGRWIPANGFLVSANGTTGTLRIGDAASGPLPALAGRGTIQAATAFYADTASFFLSMEDMALVHIQLDQPSLDAKTITNAHVEWVREEALASISEMTTASAALDDVAACLLSPLSAFPAPTLFSVLFPSSSQVKRFIGAAFRWSFWAPLRGFVRRLLPGSSRAGGHPRVVDPLVVPKRTPPRRPNQEEPSPSVLLALTCSRRIFALDAATGALLWATPLPDTGPGLVPSSRCNGPSLDGNFRIGQGFLDGGRSIAFNYIAGDEPAPSPVKQPIPASWGGAQALTRRSPKSRMHIVPSGDQAIVVLLHAPRAGHVTVVDIQTGKTIFTAPIGAIPTATVPTESTGVVPTAPFVLPIVPSRHREGRKTTAPAAAAAKSNHDDEMAVIVDGMDPCGFCMTVDGQRCTRDHIQSLLPFKSYAMIGNVVEGYEYSASPQWTEGLNCSSKRETTWSVDFALAGHTIAGTVSQALLLPTVHCV